MVDDRDLRPTLARRARLNLIGSDIQPGDEHRKRLRLDSGAEHRAHVTAVERHGNAIGCDIPRQRDLHEHLAPADGLRAR